MPLISAHMPVFEHGSRSASGAPYLRDGGDDCEQRYESFGRGDGEDDTFNGPFVAQHPQVRKVRSVLNIPTRSTLRTSRSLGILAVEMRAAGKRSEFEVQHKTQPPTANDPMDYYLSSEEDVSESADDYESSIDLGDDVRSGSVSSGRSSYEDTARAVSVVYAGKPNLVEILSQIQVATTVESPPRRRPLGLRIESLPFHIPSSRSPSTCGSSTKGSPNASIRSVTDTSYTSGAKASPTSTFRSFRRPSLLMLDPFGHASSAEPDASSPCEPTTPKTPTALAKAAWKGSLSRTISMAKRRPSLPKVSMSSSHTPRSSISSPTPTPLPYIDSSVLQLGHDDDTSPFSSSKLNLNFMIERKPVNQNQKYLNDCEASRITETERTMTHPEQSRLVEQPTHSSPITYHEIMRHAVRTAPSEQAPIAAAPSRGHQATKSRSSMLSLGLGFGSKMIRT